MSSIILVEDDPIILTLVTEFLEMDGHHVMPFPEADSAWNHIQHCSFDADLLITDLRMPGTMDGLDLVHKMHELVPLIPVMVISGFHASSSTLDDAYICWLQKPFAFEQLLEHCDRLITKKNGPSISATAD